MKNSNIQWIGEIPDDWEVSKFKYNYTIQKAKLPSKLCEDSSLIPYMSMDYIRNPYDIIPQYTNNGTYCREEDLLLLWDGSNAGEIVYKHPAGFAPSTCAVLSICSNIDKYFAKFYLRFLETKLRENTNGMGIPHVDGSFLRNLPFLLPPLPTQTSIATYLDAKCSEIDVLIADINKQIETLNELKKSTITEAVTKGLNKNAKLKDSGIQWIGMIPDNWEVIKIGRLFSLRNERNFKPMNEVQLLSLYTGIGVFPHGEQEERGNKAVSVEGYKIVHKNDIVVNIILAWMGAIGVSNYDGVTSPAYDVYIPNLNLVIPHFYHYVFRTQGIADECYRYGRGIMKMRWRTYSQEFKQISVPYPSPTEQQAIATYLDAKCTEFDSIISDKQNQISTLEAYKKSLIYEYVTGKKQLDI